MSYAAQADLETRYTAAEVSQLAASGRDIAQALADADAEIDSYLGMRYETPIAGTVPGRIVECACDIARYRLFGVTSEGEPFDRFFLVERLERLAPKFIALSRNRRMRRKKSRNVNPHDVGHKGGSEGATKR